MSSNAPALTVEDWNRLNRLLQRGLAVPVARALPGWLAGERLLAEGGMGTVWIAREPAQRYQTASALADDLELARPRSEERLGGRGRVLVRAGLDRQRRSDMRPLDDGRSKASFSLVAIKSHRALAAASEK